MKKNGKPGCSMGSKKLKTTRMDSFLNVEYKDKDYIWIIDWWIAQPKIDMRSKEMWDQLAKDFNKKKLVRTDSAALMDLWVQTIDGKLNELAGTMVDAVESWPCWSDENSIDWKFFFYGQRLQEVKSCREDMYGCGNEKYLQSQTQVAPDSPKPVIVKPPNFEKLQKKNDWTTRNSFYECSPALDKKLVEQHNANVVQNAIKYGLDISKIPTVKLGEEALQRIQSRRENYVKQFQAEMDREKFIKNCLNSKESAVKEVLATCLSAQPSVFSVPSSSKVTGSESNEAGISKGAQDVDIAKAGNGDPAVFHLGFQPEFPEVFESGMCGADSIDVKGYKLPDQVFKGISFHVLRPLGDYMELGNAIAQEYFIKIHGGTIVRAIRDIAEHTICIASADISYNSQTYPETKNKIYSPDSLKTLAANKKPCSTEDFQPFIYSMVENLAVDMKECSSDAAEDIGKTQLTNQEEAVSSEIGAEKLNTFGTQMLAEQSKIDEKPKFDYMDYLGEDFTANYYIDPDACYQRVNEELAKARKAKEVSLVQDSPTFVKQLPKSKTDPNKVYALMLKHVGPEQRSLQAAGQVIAREYKSLMQSESIDNDVTEESVRMRLRAMSNTVLKMFKGEFVPNDPDSREELLVFLFRKYKDSYELTHDMLENARKFWKHLDEKITNKKRKRGPEGSKNLTTYSSTDLDFTDM